MEENDKQLRRIYNIFDFSVFYPICLVALCGSQGIVQFRILRILLGEKEMSDGKSTKDQISQKPLWSFRQYCLFNLHFHQSFQININVDITGSFANIESFFFFLPKLAENSATNFQKLARNGVLTIGEEKL